MTRETRKRELEIGIGLVLYLLAFLISMQAKMKSKAEMLLFLLPYIVSAISIYKEQAEKFLKKQFLDENLLMIIATVGAFFVGRYKEAVAAMLFYQVGKLVEEISLSRTKKSIAKFIDIRPEYANLKIGNTEKIVPPQELNLRQTIVLHPGDKIPVDAVVTSGTGTVDMKALTGEPDPVTVRIGDRLFSGSINLNSVLEARVEKLYNDSTAAKIMRLVESANENKSESVHFVDKFTKYYTPIVILIALLTVILPPMMFVEAKAEWIYRGLIILVAACPCGLMVSIPLAFLGGIGSASKQGVLIKSGAVLEDLIRVDTYVFDKTGTLTEGVFHVKDIVPYKFEKERLLELAALAESYSKHPVALSLAEAYGKPAESTRIKDVKEEPGYGVHAFVDGLEVYAGNTRLMNREGILYAQTEKDGTAVHVAVDGKYAGYILIADTIRKDTGKLMRWMRKKNMGTVMLTGDAKNVAEQVAEELGIQEVHSELLPADKVAKVEELLKQKTEKEKLAFVGDGINDAPVLSRADIGIAMGALGSDAAIEAADVVLMDDDPMKIVKAIRIAKKCMRIVYENIYFAIGIKVICLLLGAVGIANMWVAIFADVGVMVLAVLNAIRTLFVKNL